MRLAATTAAPGGGTGRATGVVPGSSADRCATTRSIVAEHSAVTVASTFSTRSDSAMWPRNTAIAPIESRVRPSPTVAAKRGAVSSGAPSSTPRQ